MLLALLPTHPGHFFFSMAPLFSTIASQLCTWVM